MGRGNRVHRRLLRRFLATNVFLVVLSPVEGMLALLLVEIVVKLVLECSGSRGSALQSMMVGHSTVLMSSCLLLVGRALRHSSVLGCLWRRCVSTLAVPAATVHDRGRVVSRMVVSSCLLEVKILNLACVKLPHFVNLLDGGITRQVGGLWEERLLSVRNKGHRKASPSRGRGAHGSY